MNGADQSLRCRHGPVKTAFSSRARGRAVRCLTLAIVLLLAPSSAATAAAVGDGDQRTRARVGCVTSTHSEPLAATSAAIAKAASALGPCQRLADLIRDTKQRIRRIKLLLETATGSLRRKLRGDLREQKGILAEARQKLRRRC